VPLIPACLLSLALGWQGGPLKETSAPQAFHYFSRVVADDINDSSEDVQQPVRLLIGRALSARLTALLYILGC